MKQINLLLAFLLLFGISCSNNKKNKNHRKLEQKNIQLNSKNYEFKKLGSDTSALLVLIDAHADTKLAISKFRYSAKQYKINLLALKDVENGVPDYLNKIRKDINDALQNENLHPQKLFIGGFSGGARMAAAYHMQYKTDGLIMSGAGAKPTFEKPVVFAIGLKDFNFYEQFYLSNSKNFTQKNLLHLVFDGKHEWIDSTLAQSALTFLLNQNNLLNNNTEAEKWMKKAKEYKKEHRSYLEFTSLESAYKLRQNKDKQSFTLAQKAGMTVEVKEFANLLVQERNEQGVYFSGLYMKDKTWWDKKLNSLIKQSESKNQNTSNSAARQKAFIGIALYSTLNKNKSMPNNDYIKKLLYIYQKLEPENPDLFFFKAYFNYKSGDEKKTKEFLQKALELGLNKKVIAQNFPKNFF